MRFGISRFYKNTEDFIEINEEVYNDIKNAWTLCLETLYLEEKLNILTENYSEYETELLTIASKNMVFYRINNIDMSIELNLVGRRIVNLLSACKMYLDQSKHHINVIFNDEQTKIIELGTEIKRIYDDSYSFRIMEEMRNFVQHRGFPIYRISYPSQWIDMDIPEKSKMVHTVIPWVRISELINDNKFKNSVKKDIEILNNEGYFDIRPIIREYIECIGKYHETIRSKYLDRLSWCDDIICKAIERYNKSPNTESILNWAGLFMLDNNKTVKVTNIYEVIITRRERLEEKNRGFVNLHKRYSSNEIIIR